MKTGFMKNFWKQGAALAAFMWFSQSGIVAQAQPDLNEQLKAENPAPRERPEKPANGMGVPDEAIRKMMTLGGVPDVGVQDAVLAYMKEDVEARKPLRALGLKLFEALRAGDVNDDQMAALVADYRAAQEAETTRREDAQDALDANVNFTKTPRLEAMLLLAGLIGEGSGLMNAGPGGYGGRGQYNQVGNVGPNAQKREENRRKLLERFDKNANGQIDPDEDVALKQWRLDLKQQREQKEQPVNNNAIIVPIPALIPGPLQGTLPAPLPERAPNVPILPLPTDDELAEDLKT